MSSALLIVRRRTDRVAAQNAGAPGYPGSPYLPERLKADRGQKRERVGVG